MKNYIKMIEPMNRVLESRFDLRIELGSVDHYLTVLEHYQQKREEILSNVGEAKALQDPNYAKAVLISEATRMILREIAPKRLRSKKKF